MTKKQKESTAKYLYDISKGIALLAVVSNMVQGKWDMFNIVAGILSAVGFFLWGYFIEGGIKDD